MPWKQGGGALPRRALSTRSQRRAPVPGGNPLPVRHHLDAVKHDGIAAHGLERPDGRVHASWDHCLGILKNLGRPAVGDHSELPVQGDLRCGQGTAAWRALTSLDRLVFKGLAVGVAAALGITLPLAFTGTTLALARHWAGVRLKQESVIVM